MREAIIPCAGRGERMGVLTDHTPKPMLPFHNIPFLQFVLFHLHEHGVQRFLIPVAWQADVIKAYFGDGSSLGIHIEYVESTLEAESGGSFKRALAHVCGDTVVMQYGDAFFPHDISTMWDYFLQKDKRAMFVCNKRPAIKGFEDKNNIVADDEGNILAYDPDNTSGKATLHDVGVAFFKKEVLDLCDNDAFKLTQYLIPKLIAQNEAIAFISDKQSIGIGSPEKIERFKDYLATTDLVQRINVSFSTTQDKT